MGNAKIIPVDKDALFLPYQGAWIKDDSRLKIYEKSRQIGLSWSSAYRLVRKMSLKKSEAWVSSRDEGQAKLFIQDCKAFASILQLAAKDLGWQIVDEKKKISALVLQFANGSCIYSLSSNVDAQAGKRGYRLLDEFALHKDQRMLWAITYPGITWGGSMELVSTHRGANSFFNNLLVEAREGGNPKGLSVHRTTLQDALDGGFLFKLQSKLDEADPIQEMDEAAYFDFIRSGCADEESFLQEYMCQPADDESAYISYDLIDLCTYQHGEDWQLPLNPAGTYYLGMDIGRKKDLTVLYLVEAVGSSRFTRRIIELGNTTFANQAVELDRLSALPQVKRVCIDATGIGCQLVEEARARHGRKVEGVTFTLASKEDMAVTLLRCMEDARLKLPNMPKLISDLRSIRKTTTSAGNVRYEGERDENGHADRFWALALALHAAGKPKRNMFAPIAV